MVSVEMERPKASKFSAKDLSAVTKVMHDLIESAKFREKRH
jgi:hypothetical protein